jgi:hypothetical protein
MDSYWAENKTGIWQKPGPLPDGKNTWKATGHVIALAISHMQRIPAQI